MIGIAGVWTTAELRSHGVTPSALRHAVQRGRLVRVRRGVLCDGDRWRRAAVPERHAIEVYAAWLVLGRRGWASSYSAVLLADLPVPAGWPEVVDYTMPQRRQGRRQYPGLRLRTASVAPTEVTVTRGVPVARPERSSLDVAREHGFGAGLVVADAAVRAGLARPGAWGSAVATMRGWSGSTSAQLAAEHVNGARESPAESLSYAAFVTGGLVLPECNVWMLGHGPGGVRVDFLWRDHRLVGEVDGWVKYSDPRGRRSERVLIDEKQRQLCLEEAGFVVVRWTGAEAVRAPEVVIDRILRHSAVVSTRLGVPALCRDARGRRR